MPDHIKNNHWSGNPLVYILDGSWLSSNYPGLLRRGSADRDHGPMLQDLSDSNCDCCSCSLSDFCDQQGRQEESQEVTFPSPDIRVGGGFLCKKKSPEGLSFIRGSHLRRSL